MQHVFEFTATPADALTRATEWCFIGTRAALRALGSSVSALPTPLSALWDHLVDPLKPGDGAQTASTLVPSGDARPPARATVVALSDRASRHNAPGRPDALVAACRGRFAKRPTAVVLVPDPGASPETQRDVVVSWVLALARATPVFRLEGGEEVAPGQPAVVTSVAAVGMDLSSLAGALGAATDAVRLAGRLVDMPPNLLGVDRFVAECEAVAAELGVPIEVRRRAGLDAGGFGGLTSVGKAASEEPALVHLRWDPPAPSAEPVAWVGKGIVYDTGGLSLKGKFDMPGMKTDMGGAAAVLGAFAAAVRLGVPRRIDAVLCLAENAIGPAALKPDDVFRLYSGKSVEVNNTDAEGRLVLADGVAFAARDLGARVICDLATLTGAQLVSTGKLIAAIVTNDEALELAARHGGRRVGEPVHPLPFAPELFRAEFHSPIADLRNSVKDRANAQSSCAAQFIAESLDLDAVRWLHVDLAGPAVSRDRGTGFGVGLLLALFGEGVLL